MSDLWQTIALGTGRHSRSASWSQEWSPSSRTGLKFATGCPAY